MAGIKMHLRAAREQVLTVERLRGILDYDPETGIFRWKVMINPRGPVGREAGSPFARGYRFINIDCTQFYAHRLAWLYVYGKWPHELIDHIDNNPANNSIVNLRECSTSQNIANKGLRRKTNTSGYTGVFWNKRGGVWTSKMKQLNRWRHLGTFRTAKEASLAYEAEALRYWGEFRSG